MGLDDIDQWFQISKPMNEFILQQVQHGCFSSKTDYYKYLIRELMLGHTIKAFTKNDIPQPPRKRTH